MDQARPVRARHHKPVERREVTSMVRVWLLRDRVLAGLCERVRGHGRGGGGVKVVRVRIPETTCSLTRGKFPLNRIC